jgi:hypothetical protein
MTGQISHTQIMEGEGGGGGGCGLEGVGSRNETILKAIHTLSGEDKRTCPNQDGNVSF